MNLLVVDDELDMADLFQQRFRKEIRNKTLDFAFAASAEEALHYLDSHKPNEVHVLSDVNMPGMSGFQLLQKIKSDYKAPPPVVMMVTAYGDDENYRQAMALGADDFITKPVDFALLRSKLKIAN